jgi:hypothetical protein
MVLLPMVHMGRKAKEKWVMVVVLPVFILVSLLRPLSHLTSCINLAMAFFLTLMLMSKHRPLMLLFHQLVHHLSLLYIAIMVMNPLTIKTRQIGTDMDKLNSKASLSDPK